MEDAVENWLIGGSSHGVTVRGYGSNKQAERIMAELKARYAYKRLRPEGKNGRRIYHFLNVSLVEEGG